MKKLVFGSIALCLIAIQAFAWHIDKTRQVSNNQLDHYVVCDSGSVIIVTENTSINRFFVNGITYGSMSEAVNSNCN